MNRFIVIAQNKKRCCVLWLDVESIGECFRMANRLFLSKKWGRPHISMPIEVLADVEAIQVASNNDEICRYLGIEEGAIHD